MAKSKRQSERIKARKKGVRTPPSPPKSGDGKSYREAMNKFASANPHSGYRYRN
ncbi:MAG: hypothetical protein JWL87_31 [Candidatus Adlerbacteria bacterium]|nr:hypothetical protein [Candidatus Adlerbacteria bacterium]